MHIPWQWLQKRLERVNAQAADNKNDEGLTLIEMLGVVVILGIVAAIAIPSITSAITQAKANTTESDLGTLQTALSRYYMDEGAYPQVLSALVTFSTTTVTHPNQKNLWNGPYIRHTFPEHDAWANNIYYAPLDGTKHPQGYILVSGDGQTLTSPSTGTSLTLGSASATISSSSTGTVIAATGGTYSGTYIGTRPNKDSLSSSVTTSTSPTFADIIAGGTFTNQ